MPVPPRLDAESKAVLLQMVQEGLDTGQSLTWIAGVLKIGVRRLSRWRNNATVPGGLADKKPGAVLNRITPAEIEAILDGFEVFGQKDFSHRRLAYRGSYEGLFWVSPSTVARVLDDHDLRFRRPPGPGPSKRVPFPSWVSYQPRSVWVYDFTRFPKAGMSVLIIEDLVSRKWIAHVTSSEETYTQVQIAFEEGLKREGLWEEGMRLAKEQGLARPDMEGEDEAIPLLLAVSDNGPQMRHGRTRAFMATVAIAQHFGRPGTPEDQGWIEALNGTIKREWPHLNHIHDPATLRAELEVVRQEYNHHRLHSGIGYVTPEDEHQGKGKQIRQRRNEGLKQAKKTRLAYNRKQRENRTVQNEPNDA